MRVKLLGIFVLVFAVMFSMAHAASQKPEVIGVLFYADWCGSCKVLDPAIEKARGKSDLDNNPILFVRLDLTNATTRHQSELMAQTLGMGDFYEKNAGKTGFMLLVDADTKEVISTLTKAVDANEISDKVNAAISKAGA